MARVGDLCGGDCGCAHNLRTLREGKRGRVGADRRTVVARGRQTAERCGMGRRRGKEGTDMAANPREGQGLGLIEL
jgi:hypothetical protein